MIEFQERNTKYIYPYTLKEAERLGDVSLWQESHNENIACRDDIAKDRRAHV